MTNCKSKAEAVPPTQQTNGRRDLTGSEVRTAHAPDTKLEVAKVGRDKKRCMHHFPAQRSDGPIEPSQSIEQKVAVGNFPT